MQIKSVTLRFMKLHEIAIIQSGYPFRGRIPGNTNGNISVLQMRDITLGNEIMWHNLLQADIEGRREPDLLTADDILFAAKGMQNYAYHIKRVPKRCVAAPHFYQIRVKNNQQVLPEFLAWQINQRPAQSYFSKLTEGSITLSIRRSVLENLYIKIPPLKTQKQVIQLYSCFVKEREISLQLMDNRKKQITVTLEKILI